MCGNIVVGDCEKENLCRDSHSGMKPDQLGLRIVRGCVTEDLSIDRSRLSQGDWLARHKNRSPAGHSVVHDDSDSILIESGQHLSPVNGALIPVDDEDPESEANGLLRR